MKLVKIHIVEDVQKYSTLYAETPYSAANIIQSALENGITNLKIEEAQNEEIEIWNERNKIKF